VPNVGVYAVRKLKDRKNKHPTRVKSAILRFKAKDEALSSTPNQHGHKHFVVHSFF